MLSEEKIAYNRCCVNSNDVVLAGGQALGTGLTE